MVNLEPGLEIGINEDPISIIWNIKQIQHNVTVPLRDEFNRNKETETSKNERIPKVNLEIDQAWK